jgi:hypothetical protein
MTDNDREQFRQDAEQAPRYCRFCGEIFTVAEPRCPHCRELWTPSTYLGVEPLATLLAEFHGLRDAGVLAGECYTALRRTYERRLRAIRPARRERPVAAPVVWAAPAAIPVAPSGAADAVAVLPRAPAPPRPTKPPGPTLAQWTAARQADILLYLGAFFLCIAALIFVDYQGDALSGPGRFTLLLAYTVAFLTLGVRLPRWERVREAGAVFLALGAVLVPINFIALRTQVFNPGELRPSVIWFSGATVTAMLYLALARRGYGRLYAAPGALAPVIAWGALGAVFTLPVEWFGAWYIGGAAALHVAALRVRHPLARWVDAGALALAVGGLLYAHLFALTGVGTTGHLPAAYALATAGIAAELWLTRSLRARLLLPGLAATAALTAAWSAFGLVIEWWGAFAAAAALGYLLVAHHDDAKRARDWGLLAGLLCMAGLLLTHATVIPADAARAALPLTYVLALAAAGAATARWRWREAVACLPPLAVAAVVTTCWSLWAIPLEWIGAGAAITGLGYLVIAELDAARRTEWRIVAGIAAAAGIGWAHAGAAQGSSPAGQLAAAYALALAGAIRDTIRRRDVVMGALPPLAAGLGAAVTWEIWHTSLWQLGGWSAMAALGYLATAEASPALRGRWRGAAVAAALVALGVAHVGALEPGTRATQLLLTYTLVLAAALWDGVRRRDEGMGTVPPVALGLAVSVGWAAADMPFAWIAAWSAAAGLGYLVIAEIDAARRPAWRTAAGVAAFAGLLWAHGAISVPGTRPLLLPLTYGLVLAGVIWDGARRRDAGLLALPAVSALFAASVLWAVGVSVEWWVYPGLAACTAMLVTEPWWRERPVLTEAVWPYLLAATAGLPPLFMGLYGEEPGHGAVTFALATLLVLASAVRVRGALMRVLLPAMDVDAGRRTVERQMLARLSGAYLFAAAAYFNAWAGFDGADRAWVYAATGTAAWLGLTMVGRRLPELFGILTPIGVSALALAAFIARDDVGVATLVLALGTFGPALAFPATRSWPLGGIAAVFGAFAVGFGWAWLEIDTALLPLAYAAVAAALTGVLTPLRRYEPGERGMMVVVLSWAPWLLAVGSAWVLLLRRAAGLGLGDAVELTREWAVVAMIVAAGSAAVVAEGIRLRQRWVWTSGGWGLVLALLLGIAIAQPDNVQAYTLPVGLYLVALGLGYRRSPEFFGTHMNTHEAVIVAGLLFFTLPPGQQSFGPGGGKYGLELIAGGLVFLALGLTVASRWLVAGGVLTLSAVALRGLTVFGTEAPYWLTLGLVGTALLGVGMLLLLQRERWERARSRIARWWLTEA